MNKPTFSSSTRRFSARNLTAAALLVCAAWSISTPVHPEGSRRCGAHLTAEEALRRLNAARVRGAVCHRPGALAVASPVTWSPSLAAVALAQSQDMAELARMAHVDRHNRGLAERLKALGYRFSAAVENVAVGYASIDAVFDAWLESEGHCDNLMNGTVLEFGLACSDARPDGGPTLGRYWTLVLGAPQRVH